MYTTIVTPRIGDMDMLGHINNIVPLGWFELARRPIILIFDPELRMTRETFSLIIAHIDCDYVGQLYFQHEVEIRSWVSRIGTKSFTLCQEAWQQGRLCVKGSFVAVHYNFTAEKTMAIPENIKKLLAEHLPPA